MKHKGDIRIFLNVPQWVKVDFANVLGKGTWLNDFPRYPRVNRTMVHRELRPAFDQMIL